jgi:uncharacterized membrane protein
LLRINLLLLLVVAFLPFPTKLIAEGLHDTDDERVFVTLYGVTLLAIRLLLVALDTYAQHEHIYAQDQADLAVFLVVPFRDIRRLLRERS